MPSFPCLLDLLVCAGSPWFLAFASVVLIFLYKRALSKRTKFITDYASVAKDVRADTQDIEYDYIIVGGGANLTRGLFLSLLNSELDRYRRMCARIPSLRRLECSRFDDRSRYEVNLSCFVMNPADHGFHSGSTLIDSHVPGFFKRLEHSKYDYGFYTTPQSHAGGHKKYWPRGEHSYRFRSEPCSRVMHSKHVYWVAVSIVRVHADVMLIPVEALP